MEELPNEIIVEILSKATTDDKINSCMVSKRFNEAVNSMAKKIRTASDFINSCREGDLLRIIKGRQSKFEIDEECLKIPYISDRISYNTQWDYRLIFEWGIKEACRYGNSEMVEKMYPKLVKLNFHAIELYQIIIKCYENAIEGGHKGVIEVLINLPKDTEYNYAGAAKHYWIEKFNETVETGDVEMLARLVDVGEEDGLDYLESVQEDMLECAANAGKMELVQFLLSRIEYDDSAVEYIRRSLEDNHPEHREILKLLGEWV